MLQTTTSEFKQLEWFCVYFGLALEMYFSEINLKMFTNTVNPKLSALELSENVYLQYLNIYSGHRGTSFWDLHKPSKINNIRKLQ